MASLATRGAVSTTYEIAVISFCVIAQSSLYNSVHLYENCKFFIKSNLLNFVYAFAQSHTSAHTDFLCSA
jgi:hypothetical protein